MCRFNFHFSFIPYTIFLVVPHLHRFSLPLSLLEDPEDTPLLDSISSYPRGTRAFFPPLFFACLSLATWPRDFTLLPSSYNFHPVLSLLPFLSFLFSFPSHPTPLSLYLFAAKFAAPSRFHPFDALFREIIPHKSAAFSYWPTLMAIKEEEERNEMTRNIYLRLFI